MLGKFDLTLLDAPNVSDHQIEAAIADQSIDQLLARLDVLQQHKQISNRLFDNLAGYLLFQNFVGSSAPTFPFNISGGGQAALGNITLLSESSTPTYTEATNEFTNIHSLATSVETSTAGKRFVEDQIAPFAIFTDPLGRQAISFRNRWLYTPSQAVSANINSVGIYFASDADNANFTSRGRIGRVRLKDNLGTPVTFNKTINQVFLVEYTCTLASR